MSGASGDASPWLALAERLRRGRSIGVVVGLVLLGAAVVVLVRSRETIAAALAALGSASPAAVALLLASMLASVFLTGCVFWILTSRFGRVPFVEMQALMASTTLANYLPLRPGLFGRVLYHRARHQVRARDSLRTIVEAMAMSVVSLLLLVPAVAGGKAIGAPLALSIAVPGLLGGLLALAPTMRPLAAAWLLRYLETVLTAFRYHLAFGLVGTPIPAEASVAIACVSMAATLVPFVSNGIGLREWAIGLLAPVLAGYSLEQGIAAELVNRAAEVAVVVPTGLLGTVWLLRHRPRGGPDESPQS